MKPRIHVITLAVSDLNRALGFYRDGLGLESSGIIGAEFAGDETTPAGTAAMFELHGGLILALYPRTELAKDAAIPLGPPKAGEFSIGEAVWIGYAHAAQGSFCRSSLFRETHR